MHRKAVISPAALMMVGGLSACTPPEPANLPTAPTYEGVRTTLLDGDLVKFDVTIRDARGPTDIEDYARCAAAQYALIRGYGFARHLRTNVSEQGGLWTGDAIYTISPALPRGVRTIDAEVVVASCVENGIPMV